MGKRIEWNPAEYVQDIKGNPFLPAEEQVFWLRLEHPAARISTTLVEHKDGDTALFRADITLPDGSTSTGWARQNAAGQDGFAEYVEKAETSAIARACRHLGFGTKSALILGCLWGDLTIRQTISTALAPVPPLPVPVSEWTVEDMVQSCEFDGTVSGGERAGSVQHVAIRELSRRAVVARRCTYEEIAAQIDTYHASGLEHLTRGQAWDLAKILQTILTKEE